MLTFVCRRAHKKTNLCRCHFLQENNLQAKLLPRDRGNFLRKIGEKLRKNADLTARQRLEKLLDLSQNKESIEYFDNVQRVTREILQKKKNLADRYV